MLSFDHHRYAAGAALGTGLVTTLALTSIALSHKDLSYAAESRYTQMLAFFGVAIIGLPVFIIALRLWREHRMQRAYGAASSAVNDTLSYLKHERRLARSGQLPALVAAIVALTLFIAAH